MRAVVLIVAVALVASCDRPPQAPPEPQPDPPAAGEPPQASIMRPDIVAETEQPPPMEPLAMTVGFATGGAELGPEDIELLETLLASPQVARGGPIRLAGHSDSAGSDEANLAASRARGEAVRDWLVQHGVAADRISLIAFGEQNPVRPNALPDGAPDEAGRAANRRVEILVPVADTAAEEPREQTLAEEIVANSQPSEQAGEAPRRNND